MDSLIIWKSLIIFLITFLVFWVIFYTFQPGFLSNSDLAKGSGRLGEKDKRDSDLYLSDAGRTKVFLWSLIPAAIAVAFFLLYSYFMVKTVKIQCKKGSTNLGQCSIKK